MQRLQHSEFRANMKKKISRPRNFFFQDDWVQKEDCQNFEQHSLTLGRLIRISGGACERTRDPDLDRTELLRGVKSICHPIW